MLLLKGEGVGDVDDILSLVKSRFGIGIPVLAQWVANGELHTLPPFLLYSFTQIHSRAQGRVRIQSHRVCHSASL